MCRWSGQLQCGIDVAWREGRLGRSTVSLFPGGNPGEDRAGLRYGSRSDPKKCSRIRVDDDSVGRGFGADAPVRHERLSGRLSRGGSEKDAISMFLFPIFPLKIRHLVSPFVRITSFCIVRTFRKNSISGRSVSCAGLPGRSGSFRFSSWGPFLPATSTPSGTRSPERGTGFRSRKFPTNSSGVGTG